MIKTAEEQSQQKIAEVLGACTPDELRAFIDTPYSREDSKVAMTLGFCDKLAEYGLTPSDMNGMMVKTADPTASGGSGWASTIANLGTKGTIGLTILAALAGNMTGKMHHSMERRVNKMEDPENVKLREKARRLAAQRDELSEDLASRPIASVASAPAPAAQAQKQDVVQLLD